MKWTVLAATVIGAAFIYWSCIRLERVAMNEDDLFVSNFRTEIAIRLRDIAEVTENRWLNMHPVTIRFTRGTRFGGSIVFMPTTRMFAFFSSHPIVAQLRDAAARARR